MKTLKTIQFERDLQFLRELVADYQHLAPDADGNIDTRRKQNIREANRIIERLANHIAQAK
jgi:cytidylate kinase